jgi:hypothetical protein
MRGWCARADRALGKTDCTNRIGLGNFARLDYESALGRGKLLPKDRLNWGELHLAVQFGGNGHLPAFGNGRVLHL